MYLNAVVGILVGVLGVHTLGQRGEAVGQFGVELLLLALLGCEFALAGNVVEGFVDVYVAAGLVQQSTTGVELGLHDGEHVVNGREVDDFLAELLTVGSIGQRLVVGSLAQTHTLGGDTQTGTVHQGHNVFNQTQLAVAAKLGVSVLVHQLAGG